MSPPRVHAMLWAALVLGIAAVLAGFVALPPTRRQPVLGQIQGFTLTNQLGQAVTLDSLLGDVWVADIVFSRCPTQCRRLSARMRDLQRGLPSGVRLVSLTADPGHDRPEVLRAYGEQYSADPSKWWFLTGAKGELYRLAIADLKFSVLESGQTGGKLEDLFIHSSAFAIVDRRGRLRAVVHEEAPDAGQQILRQIRNIRAHP